MRLFTADTDFVMKLNSLEQQLAQSREDNSQLRLRVAGGDRRPEAQHRQRQLKDAGMERDEGLKMANDRKGQNKSDRGDAQTKEKELAEACARFADVCQYFSQLKMDPPAHIVG
jgi:hypothetical protein